VYREIPCPRCGGHERYFSSGACVPCGRIYHRRWREQDTAKTQRPLQYKSLRGRSADQKKQEQLKKRAEKRANNPEPINGHARAYLNRRKAQRVVWQEIARLSAFIEERQQTCPKPK